MMKKTYRNSRWTGRLLSIGIMAFTGGALIHFPALAEKLGEIKVKDDSGTVTMDVKTDSPSADDSGKIGTRMYKIKTVKTSDGGETSEIVEMESYPTIAEVTKKTSKADAVTEEYKAVTITVKRDEKADENAVYEASEIMPQYPGGEMALYKELMENLVYPKDIKPEGKSTMIRFTVNTDGSMSDFGVVRSQGPEFEKEAIRCIKSLSQKWTPGMIDGKTVRVWYCIPIRFSDKTAASDQNSPN